MLALPQRGARAKHRGYSSLVFPSLQGKVMIRYTRPYAIQQHMEPKGNAKGKARHQCVAIAADGFLERFFLGLTAIWKRVCNGDGPFCSPSNRWAATPALKTSG